VKKKLFLAAIPILAFGLFFTACSTESDDDSPPPPPTPLTIAEVVGTYRSIEDPDAGTFTIDGDGTWRMRGDNLPLKGGESKLAEDNLRVILIFEDDPDTEIGNFQLIGGVYKLTFYKVANFSNRVTRTTDMKKEGE
jgi:hypothetical protein